MDRLRALLREPGVAGQTNVWAEGASAIEGIPFRDREQLGPAACLAVWTIPPGPLVLHEALSRVSPEQVALKFRLAYPEELVSIMYILSE